MPWVVIAWLLAGCGRFQFDEVGAGPADGRNDGDGATDAAGDGSAITCSAATISGVDYSAVGMATTRVIAAALPDGIALGLIVDGYSPLWGVHLDPQLAPDTSTPFKTTPAGSAGYTTGSMVWTGSVLAGALDNGDGTIYLKTFASDMTTFNSADLRTGGLGYPSVASTGTAVLSFWHDGATLLFNQLQSDGQPSGSDATVGPFTATIAATSATSGSGEVAVAVGLDDLSCELVTVTTSLSTTRSPLVSSCKNPSLIASGASYTVAYESDGSIMTVTPGTPAVTIGAGSAPRLFIRNGEVLVAYRSGTTIEIARAADGRTATITGMPATIGAFDVAGPHVFAATGTTPIVVGCP